MRILLMLPKPSAHWSGLANLICESDGLLDEITMVVDGGRVRFFDQASKEVFVQIPPHVFEPATVTRLASKLAFFQWLHERFPRKAPMEVKREGSRWPTPATSRQRSAARNIRFGSTASAR